MPIRTGLLRGSLLFLLGAVGCGGGSKQLPTISNLDYSPTKMLVGQLATISGTFSFMDSDGTVQALNTSIRLPTGQEQLTNPTAVQGVAGEKAGALAFAVALLPQALGFYTFEVWLSDDSGESNHLVGTVEAQQAKGP